MNQKDEFAIQLSQIDKDKITQYLFSMTEPCGESELLRLAFPDIEICKCDTLALYQNHFLLFHFLYTLQNQLFEQSKYLYIHFMRTIIVDYPSEGNCRFFEESICQFCGASCQNNHPYCDFHAQKQGDMELELLSIKHFYLDRNNYYKLNAETADAFISGTWELLRHYDEYINSFKILDLPETSDIQLIKKKFRTLARQYHPDHGAASSEKFNEINNAYRLLLKVMPTIRFK